MRSIFGFLTILSAIYALSTAYSPQGKAIKCAFKEETLRFAGQVYSCEIENPDDFNDAAVEVTTVIGRHQRGNSDEDVEAITIRNRTMAFFPINVGKLFPNVKSLVIENMQMEAITKRNLDTFPNLEYLFLSDNKIEKIEDGWLEGNPNIKFISLHGNPITEIYPYAFNNLNNLTVMDLGGHKCKSLTLNIAKNKLEIKKMISEIDLGGCLGKDDDDYDIRAILIVIKANVTALRVFVKDYLKCKNSASDTANRIAIELYDLKREVAKLKMENGILNRQLTNAEESYKDLKSLNVMFEEDLKKIKNGLMNPVGNQSIGDLKFLTEILGMEVSRSEIMIKKCEIRTQECVKKECSVIPPCPDSSAECSAREKELDVLIRQLTTDKGKCQGELQIVEKNSSQCNNEVFHKDLKIHELNAIISGRINPPSCPKPPPSKPPVCPNDQEELRKCKGELGTCRNDLWIMGGKYDRCINNCKPSIGTGDQCEICDDKLKCIETLNQCNESLVQCKETARPGDPRCRNDLTRCEAEVENLEFRNKQCEDKLKRCLIQTPTTKKPGSDCTYELLKCENDLVQSERNYKDLHKLYKECVSTNNPSNSELDILRKKYRECQDKSYWADVDNAKCRNSVDLYIEQIKELRKKCPEPKVCPELLPSPEEFKDKIRIIKRELNVCERDLDHNVKLFLEYQVKVKTMQTDIDYWNGQTNLMTKKLIDCQSFYNVLWSDCTIGVPTACPNWNERLNTSTINSGSDGRQIVPSPPSYIDIYIPTFFTDLQRCNWEASNLKKQVTDCTEKSHNANHFVSNIGAWITRYEQSMARNLPAPDITPCLEPSPIEPRAE